jgi:L-iditol 2-dehydrogenase
VSAATEVADPQPGVPEVMRAAVLFGPCDIRVVDRRVPLPGPDEVLVRVAMCGTCGTDLKIFDGHFPQTPPLGDYTPGHEWTKRGGKIVIVAFYPGKVTFDLGAVVRKDISIHTSRGEGGNNVKRAVALAAQGKLRGAEMVTHRFPLEDITTAFRVVRERDGDPVKVVVLP